MRFVCACLLIVGLVAAGRSQPSPAPDRESALLRYGVPFRPQTYPQTDPKRTLRSVLDAIDQRDYAYLAAHLLDPAFVDARLADRAKQFEAEVERELGRLRDFQLANRDKVRPEDRVPTDPETFRLAVERECRLRAFRLLVRDIETKLTNDPVGLMDLKKILRDGMFVETEAGAKATHEQVKDRAVFFRKIGQRWFVENRQEDQPEKKDGNP